MIAPIYAFERHVDTPLNMAMGILPLLDDFPIAPSVDRGFHLAMFRYGCLLPIQLHVRIQP